MATFSGSSRAKISFGSTRFLVSIWVAVVAMRSAFAGSMPCQPRNGIELTPLYSTGRNIISMATRLVTYPISAAMNGMLT